jgi:hypothetical protein
MGNLDLRCNVRAWIQDVSKQIAEENVWSKGRRIIGYRRKLEVRIFIICILARPTR